MAEKQVFRNFDELYRHIRGKETPIIPEKFVEAPKKKEKKKKKADEEVQTD